MRSPFPPEIAFAFRERAAGDEGALAAALTAPERALLASGASAKRVAEFALGRATARVALRELGAWPEGAPPPSILRRERAPVWPPGVVGSLAHSRGAAIAAAAWVPASRGGPPAPRGRWRSIGADLERLERDTSSIARRVLRPEELAALAGRAPALVTLWFCVKECIYKALHPLTGEFLGFQDARVLLPERLPDLPQPGAGTLTWELLKACGAEFPAGLRGVAGWSVAPPWLAAGVWIEA
jgi:4'-phosphopantetheinyl transferase EntD